MIIMIRTMTMTKMSPRVETVCLYASVGRYAALASMRVCFDAWPLCVSFCCCVVVVVAFSFNTYFFAKKKVASKQLKDDPCLALGPLPLALGWYGQWRRIRLQPRAVDLFTTSYAGLYAKRRHAHTPAGKQVLCANGLCLLLCYNK